MDHLFPVIDCTAVEIRSQCKNVSEMFFFIQRYNVLSCYPNRRRVIQFRKCVCYPTQNVLYPTHENIKREKVLVPETFYSMFITSYPTQKHFWEHVIFNAKRAIQTENVLFNAKKHVIQLQNVLYSIESLYHSTRKRLNVLSGYPTWKHITQRKNV